jgi:hypothetical protein
VTYIGFRAGWDKWIRASQQAEIDEVREATRTGRMKP